MQQTARPQQNNSGNSQVQSIIITAITLFALSGAILGFAVGAFTHQHPSTNQTANNGKSPHSQPAVTTQKTATPSPTTTTTAVLTAELGCPAVDLATGLTPNTYSVRVTAKYKNKNDPNCNDINKEKTMTAAGNTCRIFLAKAKDNSPENIQADQTRFKDPTTFDQTFPTEISGLVIANNQSLTQPCTNGVATWDNLSLSPSLAKGHYYIVGVTANPAHYNFSWSGLLTN
ncbi:hypothetical protein [Dictyobacter arantiisoli]|uniref:Uncharacterized protein n=1 Tax=Dictyobacter arantiisoli TaxID=2014874 RepID=A0A5A5T6S6_9CHLR|nr:hypothetical protein [Dictyobacter arantiisoli]GCF07078.1 hypothetical protein KDI_06420 [Dictyobacter arantiisoli]